MATDPSVLSLPTLVEHMQDVLTLVAKHLLVPGPLSLGNRALAVQDLRILRTRLASLCGVVRQAHAGRLGSDKKGIECDSLGDLISTDLPSIRR